LSFDNFYYANLKDELEHEPSESSLAPIEMRINALLMNEDEKQIYLHSSNSNRDLGIPVEEVEQLTY